jgi:GxxExxY protein
MTREEYKHAALTETLIGIFFEVYNELGHGFLESVYEEAYVLVLASRGIQFQRQCPVNVFFRAPMLGNFVPISL